ncbi:MAG: hypothetical protein IT444_03615 [Phycisphaeraceae bacterium]|nr:hypothetical protein [Phycisphaeraceae bacterium]
MPSGFFVSDTLFPSTVTTTQRVSLLRQLGYAGLGTRMKHPNDVETAKILLDQMDAHNLHLLSVQISGDVATGKFSAPLVEVTRLLADRDTLIELTLMSSSIHDRTSAARADGRAIDLIRRVLDLATSNGLRVVLRPQAGSWLESIEHAVRLGMRVNQADLGLVFSLVDEPNLSDEELESRLQLALPRLCSVAISDPTDRIYHDLFSKLIRGGFAGPIMLQPIKTISNLSEYLAEAITAYRATVSLIG